MNETFDTYFAGLVDRTLRQEGFAGQTTVTNIRKVKNGHTADVEMTYRGVSKTYLATLRNGKMKVTRLLPRPE